MKDLSTNASERPTNRVCSKNGTNYQPCNRIHKGRCLTTPSPTRQCTCNQHTHRGLQHTPSPYRQRELCRYLILPSILANEDRERTVNSNQRTTRRIQRNKGASPWSSHPASNGQRLPSVDFQGCHILGC